MAAEPESETRLCSTCAQYKPVSEFREYRKHRCTECHRARNRAYARAHKEQARERQTRWAKDHPEEARERVRRARYVREDDVVLHCNVCGEDKPATEFYRSYRTRCKLCFAREAAAQYAERSQDPEFASKNREGARKWREKYPERYERLLEKQRERYRRLHPQQEPETGPETGPTPRLLTCWDCGLEKDRATDFYKHSNQCKECYKRGQRAWYQANKEERMKKQRAWREAHREYVNERQRNYNRRKQEERKAREHQAKTEPEVNS